MASVTLDQFPEWSQHADDDICAVDGTFIYQTLRLLLRMTEFVQIIGAPIACKEGVKDTWRETAEWAAGQLKTRFGESVQFKYYDLFDPACPPIPPGAQLPLVLVNAAMLSSGRKISIPAIRKRLEESGAIPIFR